MSQIRLRGPADVVAVLPYQLGYHPQDSIVLVALHGRSVGLIERIDLPPPEDAEQVGHVLVAPLLQDRPEAVMLVGYETAAGSSRPGLDAVRRLATEADLAVLDRLVVRDGRWFAIDCADGCCPAEGAPVPAAADTPAVAEYVGLEIAPLPGRSAIADLVAADPVLAEAVAAELDGDSEPESGRVDAARRLEALSRWSVVCDVTGDAPEVAELGPAEVCLLVRSLEDLALRDGLVAWLCPGALPLDSLSPDLVDALRCTLPAPTWHRSPGAGPVAVCSRGCSPWSGRYPTTTRLRRSRCSPTVPGGRATARWPGPAWTGRSGRAPTTGWRSCSSACSTSACVQAATARSAQPSCGRADPSPRLQLGRGRRVHRADAADTPTASSYDGRQVMSPSTKPRLAGRQPSSRWGAPGEDPADPDLGGKRERHRSSFDDHDLPTTSDVRCLARR